MKNDTFTIDGKRVRVFRADVDDVPVVWSSDYADTVDAVLTACRDAECPPFHFVSVTGLRWDEEMTPWPHDPIVSKSDRFTGEADAYLKLLEDRLLPAAEAILPPVTRRILNGYSLGGLFALYALHHSRLFDAASAPSASVWYPDFVRYVNEHPFKHPPRAVYLSLGATESRTKNPFLSRTQENMEALRDFYTGHNIPTMFDLNPGNHYKNVPARIAKGLKWTLTQLGCAKGVP